MKTYWGSGCIAPRILNLSTRWRWVFSFTPWLLHPKGKSTWYLLENSELPLLSFSYHCQSINCCSPHKKHTSLLLLSKWHTILLHRIVVYLFLGTCYKYAHPVLFVTISFS